MRHVSALLNRELAAYFLGPMAYLAIMGFQVIAILNFGALVETLSQQRQEYSSLRDPMSAYISASPLFWIALMVAVPVLTMRLVAEERRSGTIETLLTLPVTAGEVVVAKWLAGVVMYWALLLPFAIYLPFLYYQARFYFDIGPVLTLALGLSTMGMMLIAFGVLFSSMTRNQLVAAIWTFVVIFFLLAIPPLFYDVAVQQHSNWADVIQFTALYFQLRSFALGELDLRVVMLHLSVCLLALYLAVSIVRSNSGR
jgi:ABC-2 type transport system permease protein